VRAVKLLYFFRSSQIFSTSEPNLKAFLIPALGECLVFTLILSWLLHYI